VKVERLDDKTVLLHLDVQYNEVGRPTNTTDKSWETRCMLSNELKVGKAVKFVLSSTRYVSATVKQAGLKQASVVVARHPRLDANQRRKVANPLTSP
jgi:hypothetical protein